MHSSTATRTGEQQEVVWGSGQQHQSKARLVLREGCVPGAPCAGMSKGSRCALHGSPVTSHPHAFAVNLRGLLQGQSRDRPASNTTILLTCCRESLLCSSSQEHSGTATPCGPDGSLYPRSKSCGRGMAAEDSHMSGYCYGEQSGTCATPRSGPCAGPAWPQRYSAGNG